RSNPIPQVNPVYPVVFATALLVLLGSFMAREICARAQQSKFVSPNSIKHKPQEKSPMKSKVGHYTRAAVLAVAAATAAQAEEAPKPPPQANSQVVANENWLQFDSVFKLQTQ